MNIPILLIVEDALLRSLLTEKLEAESDLSIVGAVGDPESCLEAVHMAQPRVAVLDLQWQDNIGPRLLEQLTAQMPELNILVLVGNESEEDQLKAAQCGARGVVIKTEGISVLPQAVRAVGRGEVWFTRQISRRILKEYHKLVNQVREQEQPVGGLSGREREVLCCVAEGLTNRNIGERLHMSIHTVKLHIQHILHKLNLPNRTEAAVFAVREGLVSAVPCRPAENMP